MCRHNALLGTLSDASPIHWQYGAIARLEKGETIDKLLNSYFSTISLGYIGLYEVTKLMKGVSHTDAKGEEFSIRVMKHLDLHYMEHQLSHFATDLQELIKKDLEKSKILQIKDIIQILIMLMLEKK